jgi:hypothetical protein
VATVSHGTLTMTGSAIQVSVSPVPIRKVRFEYDDAYSANIFIGGAGVTATSYGFALTAVSSTTGWIEFDGAGAGNLSDFWAIGSSSDKVHYTIIEAL